MPTPRVTMQQLKECFRLKFECALSHERIARTLGLSKGVIGKDVSRAQVLGLTWVMLATWDEAQIKARLCLPTPAVRGVRASMDLPWVHRELRRKGVTLQLRGVSFQRAPTDSVFHVYCGVFDLGRSTVCWTHVHILWSISPDAS